MPIVKVYECPKTGTYFPIDKKDRYLKHLKTLARNNLREKKDNYFAQKAMDFYVNECANKVKTASELQEWWSDNFAKLVNLCKKSETLCNRFRIEEDRDYSDYSIMFDNLRYNESCSNSHNAPWGQKTNWCNSRKGNPTGFPGLEGRITIFYKGSGSDFDQSRFITHFGLSTGSGGGGGGSLSYGVTVWFMDHTGIANEYHRQESLHHEWNDFIVKERAKLYAARKEQYENRADFICQKLNGTHIPFEDLPWPYQPYHVRYPKFEYDVDLNGSSAKIYLKVLKNKGYRIWFNDGDRMYVVLHSGKNDHMRSRCLNINISCIGTRRNDPDVFWMREPGCFYGSTKPGFETEANMFFRNNKAPYHENTMEIPDELARLQDSDYQIGL